MMGQDSKLFICGALDLKEEIESKLEYCHKGLDPSLPNLPTEKLYEVLNLKVCKGQQEHEEITFGLLYIILTDKSLAPKAFHLLTMLTQDSMGLILREVEIIIMEKMHFMKDTPRVQVVWLTRELVGSNAADAERLCFALLKQTPCGDIGERNVIVIEHLLHLLLDFRSWLESQPALIASVVYTYLSLIPDHMSSSFTNLRDEEVSLCASLLQNKFADCMLIGRDLVRLLQNVARIPQFTNIWKDIIFNPQSLNPNFTGLEELMNIRTSRRFIAGRLTSDMETKLNFLTSKVKFGLHKRYQLWFQQKYFSTPESQSLVVDVIRYLCCVIHPTNEVLCSDIIPRWLLIGWLLSLCTGNINRLYEWGELIFGQLASLVPNPSPVKKIHGVISANAKLALFFDWLLYNKDTDNIMNVEPGILVMYHSLKTYPHITSTLLEFLLNLRYEYCSMLTSACNKGVKSVFEDVVTKQVIPNLSCFFESSSLDENLKQQFSSLLSVSNSSIPAVEGSNVNEADVDLEIIEIKSKGENVSDEACFSDEIGIDDEISSEIQELIAKGSCEDLVDKEILTKWENLDMPDNLKQAILSLSRESDFPNRTLLLNDIFDIISKIKINDEICAALTEILTILLKDELLEDYTVETTDVEDSVTCVLRHAVSNDTALKMIPSFQEVQSMMGIYLLQYLNHSKKSFAPYKKLSQSTVHSFHEYLYADVKICVENDSTIFFELLPKLYHQFSSDLIGSVEFLNLIVTNVDPQQLCDVICKLMRKEFYIFGADSVGKMIKASLEWDTFEQICVWQLLNGEEPPVLSVASLLPDLHKSDHPEALANTLLYIKRAVPEQTLLSIVLQLPPESHEDCVTALLKHWTCSYPFKLGEAFSCHSSLQTTLSSHPSTTYILNQLTIILQTSSQVMNEVLNEKMQRTLNALFAEDPLLPKKFEYIHRMLKHKTVKHSSKLLESTSSDDEDLMPLVKRRKKRI